MGDDFCISAGGGPPINTDISGIGVRISFYLQTLCLALLCIRSTSIDEIIGSMYTLLSTNIAMAVTAFILGLKPSPEISLHDALVVLYLLSLSWVTVVLSLPWVNRLSDAPRLVNIFSIVQSYAFIAFALVVLVTAHTFGGTPDCNPTAKVVLFRPFQFFEAGRILAWILISSILFAYTVLTIMDYMPPKQKQKLYELRKIRIRRLRPSSEDKSDLPQHINPNTGLPEPALNKNAPKMTDPASMLPHLLRHETHIHHVSFSGRIVFTLSLVGILWALAVMNTELLISWNKFDSSDNSQSVWQFGQVLPLCLLVNPLASVVTVFTKHGLRPSPLLPKQRVQQGHR